MAYFSQEELNSIREKADIVDVVSHYIPVEKHNNSYRAVCPFHDDHDPSMNLNPNMQIYKCFACGAGGNVFSFVQNYEHVSFVQAVETVANLVGVSVSTHASASLPQADPQHARYYTLLQDAIKFSMYELNSEEAEKEKAYLEKRGLNEKVREKFEIGYIPDHNKLYKFLHAKEYSDADMIAVNLARNTESGIQDVFYKRITFPIHDENGHPIGFSARSIDPNNPSKYINTTNTDIYVKGNVVFNAHRAKQEARRQRKIYLCEGVTDVIAFDTAGISNAVCTLGTSCTNEQMRAIKKMSREVVFCYDGDNAGQHATMRGIQMALDIGCQVSVVENKTGKDPDEIVRQDGKEALLAMVSKPISWIEFALQYEESRTNMDSYLEKKAYVEKAQQYISRLQDDISKKYFTDLVSKKTGFEVSVQASAAPVDVKPSAIVRKVVPDGIAIAQEQILCMMLKYPSACRIYEDELGYLLDPKDQALAIRILNHVHKTGRCDPQVLMDECEEQELQNLLTSILSSDMYSMELDESVLRGMMNKVRYAYLLDEKKSLLEQMSSTLNPDTRAMLMRKYTSCLQKLRGYIHEEDH